MSYDARVFRILIASPGDVEDERETAVSVIQRWNDLHSRTRGIVLLPLRWETHTAPEFGARPQEAINRAIVDDCDLVVGIFWTRLGSPSGLTDSGTLEEIERASEANKPVMLYFSRVPTDPSTIDLSQIKRLRGFEEAVKKKALVETYKSRPQFDEKFFQQLEMKVRELEDRIQFDTAQFDLNFLNYNGSSSSNKIDLSCIYYDISDVNKIPQELQQTVRTDIRAVVRFYQTTPLILLLKNIGTQGVRNLFVEIYMRPIPETAILSTSTVTLDSLSPNLNDGDSWPFTYSRFMVDEEGRVFPGRPSTSSIKKDDAFIKRHKGFDTAIAEYTKQELKQTTEGWRCTVEWDALQPHRERLIEPIIYVSCFEDTLVEIRAKIFADTFPNPVIIDARASISVDKRALSVDELLPDWRSTTPDIPF